MNQIYAWLGTIVLSMSVTWKIVSKWHPKIRRSLKITNEALEVINAILDAMEDRKITKQEIEQIFNEVQDLQLELER